MNRPEDLRNLRLEIHSKTNNYIHSYLALSNIDYIHTLKVEKKQPIYHRYLWIQLHI